MNLSNDKLFPLSDEERLARLRLARSETVGPITFRGFLERFGSATRAIAALPSLAKRKALALMSRAEAEQELDTHAKLGARLIHWGEADYPTPLAGIANPPPVLSVRGDGSLLQTASVAIVGARNASAGGRRIAETIARDLGEAGLAIVSGLARGIDTSAHRGALKSGTVAVLPAGVERVYPPENAPLYEAIVAEGAVIAELPPGTEIKAQQFPRRNRLIAGLSLGVIVIEAAKHSGSLITARLALEESREVFAIPGSPLDPRCHGSNDLIRQGATLVETADHVLAELPAHFLASHKRLPTASPAPVENSKNNKKTDSYVTPMDPAESRSTIVEALGPSPVTVDELVRRCQLSPAVVASVLLELELEGRLERHAGQRVSLVTGGGLAG
jgi:DNA processing protein